MEELITLSCELNKISALRIEANVNIGDIQKELYKIEQEIFSVRIALNAEISELPSLICEVNHNKINSAKERLIECRDRLNDLMKKQLAMQNEKHKLIESANKYERDEPVIRIEFTKKLNALRC